MKRLILFDIDGTLLSTNLAAKRAFHRAMLSVYGEAGPIDNHRFDGKTDPQIARELLQLAGFEDPVIEEGFVRLWPEYLAALERELGEPHTRVTVYPGVHELLEQLFARDDVLVGLLTGNIESGAKLKISAAQLPGSFAVGAFGSDSERRDQLPAIAVGRARELTGIHFRGRDVVIIGDTPSDVSCGRSIGVHAVGVATGRHSVAELHACGADAVLADFADTARVLEAIL
jgi:phosphoglycolate phosphatase-like HAD superfamily hydrolase